MAVWKITILDASEDLIDEDYIEGTKDEAEDRARELYCDNDDAESWDVEEDDD